MRHARTTPIAFIAALAALVLASSCDSSSGTDSNTHWLDACTTDADCGSLSCLCGACTASCETDTTCRDLSPRARCAELPAIACRGTAPRACGLPCREDADCPGSHLSCLAGQCHPGAGDPDAGSGGKPGAGGAPRGGAGGAAVEAGLPGSGGVPAEAGAGGGTGGAEAGVADAEAGSSDAGDARPAPDSSVIVDASSEGGDAQGPRATCNVEYAVAWGDEDIQNARDLAVDGQGNVIIGGYHQGTLTGLGDPPYLAPDPVAGYNNGYVAKLAPDGHVVWRRGFSGAAGTEQYVLSVAVAANGDVVVGGKFQTEVAIGSTTLLAAGGFYGMDSFVARLSGADGGVLQLHQIGGAGSQSVSSVAVDSSSPSYPDAIVAAGHFDTEIDCSDGPTPATCASAGGDDLFVMKLWDQNTRNVWTFGGVDAQSMYAMDVDATGSVAVAGAFKGSLSFGGGTPTLTAVVGTTPDLTDAFAARIDLPAAPGGVASPVFATAFHGGCADPSYRRATAIAFDRNVQASGALWVAGDSFGCVDLLGVRHDAPGTGDAFVVRLGRDTGTLNLAHVYAAQSRQHATDLAVDEAGFIYVAGSVRGTVTFAELGTSPRIGLEDAYIVRLTPAGEHSWFGRWGGGVVSAPHARGVGGPEDAVARAPARGALSITPPPQPAPGREADSPEPLDGPAPAPLHEPERELPRRSLTS